MESDLDTELNCRSIRGLYLLTSMKKVKEPRLHDIPALIAPIVHPNPALHLFLRVRQYVRIMFLMAMAHTQSELAEFVRRNFYQIGNVATLVHRS